MYVLFTTVLKKMINILKVHISDLQLNRIIERLYKDKSSMKYGKLILLEGKVPRKLIKHRSFLKSILFLSFF